MSVVEIHYTHRWIKQDKMGEYSNFDENMKSIFFLLNFPVILIYMLASQSCTERRDVVSNQGIMVCEENPYYFQYKGKPILLLGASDYHNIFQRPDLIEHLEEMQSYGGNYVRNTMASREITFDHNDLWPYKIVKQTDDSLINIYDLDQWNELYWQRFNRMLEETHKRGIIVEIELHFC